MYGVQNGQDDVTYGGADVHNDNPGEVILRLEAGLHHGYPFCFAAQRINSIAPGTQVASEIFAGNTRDDAWCQNTTNVARPVTFMQAHSAPMDITFFTSAAPAGNLPERWRNGAFVSLHGSWNREPATGYRVVWIPFAADGTSTLPTNSGSTTTFPHEVVLSRGNASASQDGTWNVYGRGNERPPGRRRGLARRRRALHLVRLGRLRLPRRPATMTRSPSAGPPDAWVGLAARARRGRRLRLLQPAAAPPGDGLLPCRQGVRLRARGDEGNRRKSRSGSSSPAAAEMLLVAAGSGRASDCGDELLAWLRPPVAARPIELRPRLQARIAALGTLAAAANQWTEPAAELLLGLLADEGKPIVHHHEEKQFLGPGSQSVPGVAGSSLARCVRSLGRWRASPWLRGQGAEAQSGGQQPRRQIRRRVCPAVCGALRRAAVPSAKRAARDPIRRAGALASAGAGAAWLWHGAARSPVAGSGAGLSRLTAARPLGRAIRRGRQPPARSGSRAAVWRSGLTPRRDFPAQVKKRLSRSAMGLARAGENLLGTGSASG